MNHPAEEQFSTPPPGAVPPEPAAPVPQPQVVSPALSDPRRKSPVLAVVLSIVVAGLGQVYVGYYKRGFIHAIVVAILITLLVSEALGALLPLASIFLAFFYFYNVVDAGRRASLYNLALAGGSAIELPEEFETPGLRGSIVGGAALILVGLVLLSNTLFGVSLAWLEQWWPVAVVAFGGYLVYKAMQERSAGDPTK